MHELMVTENIVNVVLDHVEKNNVRRVLVVSLKVGELCGLQKGEIQKYFDYLTGGTALEGANLEIERVPVVFRCDRCSYSFSVEHLDPEELICPECRSPGLTMVSGKEFYIQSMEAI